MNAYVDATRGDSLQTRLQRTGEKKEVRPFFSKSLASSDCWRMTSSQAAMHSVSRDNWTK